MDALGEFILADRAWFAKEVNPHSGPEVPQEQNASSDQLAPFFNPDQSISAPPIDDAELLSHVTSLTEVEFRCLLKNRPECWDTDLQMEDKTKKHVDLLLKLYQVKNAE